MTINLTNNSSNTVRLTLSESVSYTGSNVYFLFRFYNLASHTVKLFSATDTSTNIERYNCFNITLTGSSYENLTGGTINIVPDGELFYEVYEQLSRTNLALSGTSGRILENGIVKVSGTTNNIIAKSYTGQSSTYNYYDGQYK